MREEQSGRKRDWDIQEWEKKQRNRTGRIRKDKTEDNENHKKGVEQKIMKSQWQKNDKVREWQKKRWEKKLKETHHGTQWKNRKRNEPWKIVKEQKNKKGQNEKQYNERRTQWGEEREKITLGEKRMDRKKSLKRRKVENNNQREREQEKH